MVSMKNVINKINFEQEITDKIVRKKILSGLVVRVVDLRMRGRVFEAY